MTLTVTFVRHAESWANVDPSNRIGGRDVNVELTDRGVGQALALRKRLEGRRFDYIYSSPAVRAIHTCTLAMQSQPDCTTPELLEADSGDFSGLSRDIYDLPEIREQLNTDSWNFIPGFIIKGESRHQVADRMLKWLYTVIAQFDGNVTVFTHGLAIKYMLTELLYIDQQRANEINIDNASITELKFTNGILYPIVVINDTSHLE